MEQGEMMDLILDMLDVGGCKASQGGFGKQ